MVVKNDRVDIEMVLDYVGLIGVDVVNLSLWIIVE